MKIRQIVLTLPLVTALAACGPAESPPAASDPDKATVVDTEPAAPTGAATPAALPQQLEAGRSWTLAGASDAGLQSVAEVAGIFIEVQEGRLVGYAGCNRFSAPLTRGEGTAIQLGAAVATKRACVSDALNAAEQRFLETLTAVRSFELNEQGLSLSTADGASLSFIAGRPGGSEGEASQAEGT